MAATEAGGQQQCRPEAPLSSTLTHQLHPPQPVHAAGGAVPVGRGPRAPGLRGAADAGGVCAAAGAAVADRGGQVRLGMRRRCACPAYVPLASSGWADVAPAFSCAELPAVGSRRLHTECLQGRSSHPVPRTACRAERGSLLAYFASGWSWVDLASNGLMAVCISLWWVLVEQLAKRYQVRSWRRAQRRAADECSK